MRLPLALKCLVDVDPPVGALSGSMLTMGCFEAEGCRFWSSGAFMRKVHSPLGPQAWAAHKAKVNSAHDHARRGDGSGLFFMFVEYHYVSSLSV